MSKLARVERKMQTRSLPLQIVQLLGSRIVSGEITEGETLPNEDELAIELGVSRTVIREGVKMLTAKGLLEVRTRVGTTVLPKSHWNLLDPDVLTWCYESGPTRSFLNNLIEVRQLIEVRAAELAAVRATGDDIKRLEERYRLLEEALEHDEAYIEADISFHEAIFNACHNELLEQIARTLRQALKSSRKITVQIPGSSRDALPLHHAVVQAISKRDADEAKRATLAIIDRSKQDIEAILEHAGLD